MSLSSKLARLEILVRAQSEEDRAPTFWTGERVERWRQWAVRLLETMPKDRARRAYYELTELPAEHWGPITRRLDHLAYLGVEGIHDSSSRAGRVVALPDAVCAVLEANPDALWTSDFSCEDCGLETPHRSWEDWNRYRAKVRARGDVVDPADRALMTACPLCGGRVRWAGWTCNQSHEAWLRQKAELAARASPCT